MVVAIRLESTESYHTNKIVTQLSALEHFKRNSHVLIKTSNFRNRLMEKQV